MASRFVRISNILLDPDKVAYVEQDERKEGEVRVMFDGGASVTFKGDEAVEVWKLFDDGGWKVDNGGQV